ncbi:MAG: hypothetical protein LBH76_02200 [Propionibacteriaceae bacterium]|jgi:hypothetical protein|nr:hypothetical protein [Propionibacteriaceae bacterium]
MPPVSWENIRTALDGYLYTLQDMDPTMCASLLREVCSGRDPRDRRAALRVLRDVDPSVSVQLFDWVLYDALYVQGEFILAREVIEGYSQWGLKTSLKGRVGY